jgi:hypothetical protein
MGIFLTFIASVFLYSKSKYVPEFLKNHRIQLLQHKNVVRVFAYFLFFVSIWVLAWQLGFWTGLVTFTITWMFSMCLVIFIFPLNGKLPYIICGLSLLFIILENIV